MKRLRNLSARPELVVDRQGVATTDTTDASRVGIPGPFGNERLVEALPLNKAGGAQQLVAPRVIHDSQACYLADSDGNVVGAPGVWIARLVSAGITADTRRL